MVAGLVEVVGVLVVIVVVVVVLMVVVVVIRRYACALYGCCFRDYAVWRAALHFALTGVRFGRLGMLCRNRKSRKIDER